jgi:hypothetical protein
LTELFVCIYIDVARTCNGSFETTYFTNAFGKNIGQIVEISC